MLSKLSAWFVNPRRNPLARAHRNAVAARLRKYGLYRSSPSPHTLSTRPAADR
jgi:ubiquinol-cytochrome c reductase subunit 7